MSRLTISEARPLRRRFDESGSPGHYGCWRISFWPLCAAGLALLLVPLSGWPASPARTLAVAGLVVAVSTALGWTVWSVLPAASSAKEARRIAVVLGLVVAVVPHHLFESNGGAEPGRAEAPADLAVPLGPTQAEAAILARFAEPQDTWSSVVARAAPPDAKVAETLDIPDVSDDVIAQARRFYALRCISCHGATGDGKGAAAQSIQPPPRDYTAMEWQKAVSNERLAAVIVKGGAATGGSYMMPPSPELNRKPALVDGLVALVRSFAVE